MHQFGIHVLDNNWIMIIMMGEVVYIVMQNMIHLFLLCTAAAERSSQHTTTPADGSSTTSSAAKVSSRTTFIDVVTRITVGTSIADSKVSVLIVFICGVFVSLLCVI
jgi:hypothetical protein